MKHLSAFLFAVLFTGLVSTANTHEIKTSSYVTDATVYLRGADVTSTATLLLQPGTNKVIFEDLTSNLDPSSISVACDKPHTIVAVNHEMNYISGSPKNNLIEHLEGKLKDHRFKLDMRNNLKDAYKEEKSLLLTNKSIGGKDKGVDVEDLIDMAEFYRKRLKEINYKVMEIDYEIEDIQEEIKKIRSQLNQERSKFNRSSSDISITLNVKSKSTTEIQVTYFVQDAGWQPSYDIRSSDIDAPISIVTKGEVYQRTGYDWKDVNLTLSTGNPTLSHNIPNLSPWTLRYYQEVQQRKRSKYGEQKVMSKQEGIQQQGVMADAEDDYSGAAPMAAMERADTRPEFNVQESGVNKVFKVDTPYAIKSGSKPYLVEISTQDFTAEYHYYAVPKLDNDAFLKAKITEWENYIFLPGEASIFYQGAFTGKSSINPKSADDTLSVSLGRDKAITIERTRVKDHSQRRMIGSTRKHEIAYEIKIRNGKSKAIQLTLEDQVPISSIKEIEVSDVKASGAEHNESNGKLNWNLQIEPRGTAEVKFSYSVKHPKDKRVILE